MISFLRNLKRKRRPYKEFILWGIAFFVVCTGIFLLWISTFRIPTLDSFEQRRIAESTKIYDRTGEILLYDVNQDIRRTVMPFEEISRNIKNATIAIEDQEFYSHNGVKPRAFLRAVLVNLASLEFSQGGSTITQQVVKNSILTTEKRISRKIKEWVLAIKLENMLTKDEILAMYLNESPYGGNIYGVEEASQVFFGVSSADLSIAQAAYLAALPQAPTFYSPYGKNVDRLEVRKNLVLSEMLENGFITEEEYNGAKAEVVTFAPRPEQSLKAPHFVFYVIEQLEKKYGENVVQNGGLKVITTLDYSLQEKGEVIAKEYALSNKEKFNAENAAFVAIDPTTGHILSMVGSRDYFDEEIDGNFNVTTGLRQPGSTFKPFVYAQAFIKGYTPETIVFDLKTQFSTNCAPENLTSDNGCYSPVNYDNVFRGPMTLRNALAQSINVPAVKTLYLAGISDSLRLAENMGISTLTGADRYGLTLVLGGGEVTPLDITSAYGVFANEGVRHSYTSIIEIKDRNNTVLESYQPQPRTVLDQNTARQISDILSDNVARTPAFGANSLLYYANRDVAVKTGTTNDYRDAWIIGYTPNVVLGAWAGNNDNSPMERRVAGFIVAPMWREFMDEIVQSYEPQSFNEPIVENSFELKPILRGQWRGGKSHLIDSVSKKLATEYTPLELIEEILTGEVNSILYWVDKDNPRGPVPTNPARDNQFMHWQYPVRRWAQEQGIVPVDESLIPQTFDDVHTPELFPSAFIQSPLEGAAFDENERIEVRVDSTGPRDINRIEFFVDNVFIGDVRRAPFVFSFIPEDSNVGPGTHTLRAVVYDLSLNRGEDEINFSIE